jgi:hypothetical protein
VPKVNVYLSDDLHEQVKEFDISLSPICQAAVREEIERTLAGKRATQDLAPVLTRLLVSKAEEDKRRYREGYDFGVKWARNQASLSELERLEVYADSRGFYIIDLSHFPSLVDAFIGDAQDRDLDPDPDWFESLRGDKAYDRGVVEGAVALYAAVKVSLESERKLESDAKGPKRFSSITATPTGRGHWRVTSDGEVRCDGDALFFGSLAEIAMNSPIVAFTPTPSGSGYWLVTSDGGVFAFGDAPFVGSIGSSALSSPVVDMAATPTGRGYWLLTSDGGVSPFGDAELFIPPS